MPPVKRARTEAAAPSAPRARERSRSPAAPCGDSAAAADDGGSHTCPFPDCSASFTRKTNLYRHLRTQHNQRRAAAVEDPDAAVCSGCGCRRNQPANAGRRDDSDSDSDTESDEDVGDTPDPAQRSPTVRPADVFWLATAGWCSCRKRSSIKKGRQRERSKVHRCPEPDCDAVFTLRWNLQSHIQTAHGKTPTGFVVHHCPACDQAFSTKSNLRVHYRQEHGKQQTFECETCGYAPSVKWHLRQHMGSSLLCSEARRYQRAVSVGDHFDVSGVSPLLGLGSPLVQLAPYRCECGHESETLFGRERHAAVCRLQGPWAAVLVAAAVSAAKAAKRPMRRLKREPGVKAEAKAEVRAEVKAEVRAEVKAEVGVKAETKLEVSGSVVHRKRYRHTLLGSCPPSGQLHTQRSEDRFIRALLGL
eukprot:TRINITY_DN39127_c0_g1_i2.p1 TRINITY_DN39127_c0_g1~~TRINITY_DN39127_c0_g1_i2.p1  ORF type:complete len:438 (+),score=99.76 TRINITY_DN39127_c0_g1_i2:61-1314(+)